MSAITGKFLWDTQGSGKSLSMVFQFLRAEESPLLNESEKILWRKKPEMISGSGCPREGGPFETLPMRQFKPSSGQTGPLTADMELLAGLFPRR